MSSTGSLLAALAVVAVLAHAAATFLPKRVEIDYGAKDMIIDPKKRPFCNAFTGCGRKRSNLPPLPLLQEQLRQQYGQPIPKPRRVMDDSIANLLELNSEPGLEDLSRKILSEAKLWEAIQEANVELRREQEGFDNQEMPPQMLKSPNGVCLFPPCYV